MFLSAIAVSAALALPSAAQADDAADQAKIESLLQQTGLGYERKGDTVFVVPEQGKSLGDFNVVLANGDGMEVIFVIIAQKAQMPMNEALALKMLSMNHEYDRVKVGIDDDGDAFVRDDASIRVLDGAELKENIHQVAAAADEIYAALKPYLQ
jgi:hypothetical protein